MKAIPLFLTLVLVVTARAEVTLPATFSDHLIPQAGAAVPVWGWAAPGVEVTVSIAGQTKSASLVNGAGLPASPFRSDAW